MEIIRKEYSLHSVTGLADVFVRVWSPDSEVKALFQITHGMAEHGERYEDFAKHLCEKGFAVIVNDHIGHGKSVKSDADLGYFGDKDGWNSLVEDERNITLFMEKEYPDIPLIYFGHSMGSFIGREYIRRYAKVDKRIKGAIICGTGGKNPVINIAIALANTIAKAKGSRHRSEFINKLAFGAYNKQIPAAATPFDWLSTDKAQVDKYIADKYCGFLFTAAGYRDLFVLLKTVSAEDWFDGIPTTLPILLTSGQDDPVGEYGKGVRWVYNGLRERGIYDLTLKLYPGMRHEILNETENKKVYEDMSSWALSKIAAPVAQEK